jgi:Ca2+-binding EF-hand superfamily protein
MFRSNPVRNVILVLAAGLGATALGACAAETTDAPTNQTAAALSANEPAKGDHAFKGRGPDALFARWDKDGDGKVALADLPEKMKTHLAQADANQDGVLTRDELAQAHQTMRAEREKQLDGDGTVSEEERAQARGRHHAERFARADQNHDGSLSADEVPAPRWEHIQVADANGDGKVTAAELDAAMAAGKIKPPPRHRGKPPADSK